MRKTYRYVVYLVDYNKLTELHIEKTEKTCGILSLWAIMYDYYQKFQSMFSITEK